VPLRRVPLYLTIVAVVVVAAPSGSLADQASTTDVALVQTLSTASEAWHVVAPLDPSAQRYIGDRVRADDIVTNIGAVPTQVRFTVNASPDTGALTAPVVGVWSDDAAAGAPTCDPSGTPYVCTKTLAPGESWHLEYHLSINGTAPITVDSAVASSTTDSNPSNDTAEYQTAPTCQVMGTPGDDTLVAGPGQAACGLGGDDRIVTEPGAIAVLGGPGDDTFLLGNADGVYAVGGAGFDTATYSGAPNPIHLCPGANGVLGSGGSGSPERGAAALSDVESIVGTPFDDRLEGTSGANMLAGGGGNDWITGGGGDDSLAGGGGNDLMNSYDRTPDVLRGGAGSDRARVDASDQLTSTTPLPTAPYPDPCKA
jgi:Ca2+-binding RTX toxin-like protein